MTITGLEFDILFWSLAEGARLFSMLCAEPENLMYINVYIYIYMLNQTGPAPYGCIFSRIRIMTILHGPRTCCEGILAGAQLRQAK